MERHHPQPTTAERPKQNAEQMFVSLKAEIESLIESHASAEQQTDAAQTLQKKLEIFFENIKTIPDEREKVQMYKAFINDIYLMDFPPDFPQSVHWNIYDAGPELARVLRLFLKEAISKLARGHRMEDSGEYLLSLAREMLNDQRTTAGTNLFSCRQSLQRGMRNADLEVGDLMSELVTGDPQTIQDCMEIFVDPSLSPGEAPFTLGSPPYRTMSVQQKRDLSERHGKSYFYGWKSRNYDLNPIDLPNRWRKTVLGNLETSNASKARQYIDGIIGWLIRDPYAFDSRVDVITAFKKLNGEYAISKLAEVLRDQPSPHVYETVLFILDHLEDAEIPVTKKGVTYLGTQYDLGEMNVPRHVARRLTPDGKVGILDEKLRLKKYFETVRSAPVVDGVKADVKDITIDDLFYPDASDTEETRCKKEHMKETFLSGYGKGPKGKLSNFDLELNNFTLREQGVFAMLYEELDEKGRASMMGFLTCYKERGMKALLSFQFQPEKLASLFELHLLPSEGISRVNKVLRGFWDMADLATGITDDLLEKYVVQDRGQKVNRRRLEEEIMRRGSAALMKYAATVASKKVGEQKIRQAIQGVNQQTMLLGAILRSAFQGKHEVDFAELKDIEINDKTMAGLLSTERSQMQALLRENWEETKPGAYTSMRRELFPEPESDLYKGASYSLLKRDNAVLAYMRFEPDAREAGALRADYLNVAGGLQDSGVGCAFLKETLDRQAQDRVIRAEFYPEANVGSFYIEKFGFVGTGVGSEPQGSGETQNWIEMRRDDQANTTYRSRQPEVTLDEIKRWAKGKPPSGVSVQVLRSPRGSFTGEDLTQRMQRESQRRPSSVLARYLFEKQEGVEVRYFVFEVPPVARRVSRGVSARAA